MFQVATTREGSGIILLNEPLEDAPEARCLWWRRGRVELPVQGNLLKTYYRLSWLFSLTQPTSVNRVWLSQSILLELPFTDFRTAAPRLCGAHSLPIEERLG